MRLVRTAFMVVFLLVFAAVGSKLVSHLGVDVAFVHLESFMPWQMAYSILVVVLMAVVWSSRFKSLSAQNLLLFIIVSFLSLPIGLYAGEGSYLGFIVAGNFIAGVFGGGEALDSCSDILICNNTLVATLILLPVSVVGAGILYASISSFFSRFPIPKMIHRMWWLFSILFPFALIPFFDLSPFTFMSRDGSSGDFFSTRDAHLLSWISFYWQFGTIFLFGLYFYFSKKNVEGSESQNNA